MKTCVLSSDGVLTDLDGFMTVRPVQSGRGWILTAEDEKQQLGLGYYVGDDAEVACKKDIDRIATAVANAFVSGQVVHLADCRMTPELASELGLETGVVADVKPPSYKPAIYRLRIGDEHPGILNKMVGQRVAAVEFGGDGTVAIKTGEK